MTQDFGRLQEELKRTGGAAFPTKWDNVEYYGLTARDYFAGQALAGICAGETDWSDGSIEINAQLAYACADAMLKERTKDE